MTKEESLKELELIDVQETDWTWSFVQKLGNTYAAGYVDCFIANANSQCSSFEDEFMEELVEALEYLEEKHFA